MSGRVCGRDAIVACIAFRYGVRQEPTGRRSAKRRHRWTVNSVTVGVTMSESRREPFVMKRN